MHMGQHLHLKSFPLECGWRGLGTNPSWLQLQAARSDCERAEAPQPKPSPYHDLMLPYAQLQGDQLPAWTILMAKRTFDRPLNGASRTDQRSMKFSQLEVARDHVSGWNW
jgi:hypothetical protein